MNRSIIVYIVGWVVRLESLFMLLPALVALCYGEKEGFIFLICTILFFPLGWLLTRKKPEKTEFYAKEGFVMVALSWIVLSIIGSVPFIVSGEIPSIVDALFEIVSGFTTTGASILHNVEALSHGMLFWRSFSHWIGGMGVLVFILAILPMAAGQNLYLMKAESTGPQVGKLVPKMQKTAFILYAIYTAMTVIQLILLLCGRMPFFDAICVTFGTAGTGGFGVLNDSYASYSPYIQTVTTIFMFLFGVNFNFYYLVLIRNVKDAFHMEEVKWYFIIYAVATLAITLNLCSVGGNFFNNLHHVAFQTSSIMTTTGFATVDFNLWPQFSRAMMVFLMFVGACAGSTGGGIKVSRIVIYIKGAKKELSRLIHPRSVKVLKMDGKAIDKDTLKTVNSYLALYFVIFLGSFLAICFFDGYDLTSSFTAVAATLNNIGPGLDAVGPTANYAGFTDWSKIVLIFDMLAGRLELFPMLLLFSPGTWRK